MNQFEKRGALRAKRTAVGWVIRIALDVNNFGFLAFGEVAFRIHDDAAADGTIGAGIARLRGTGELPSADRSGISRLNIAESERAERGPDGACGDAVHKMTSLQFDVHENGPPGACSPARASLFSQLS